MWPLAMLLAVPQASAGAPEATGAPVTDEIRIDGRLDEAAWNDAPLQVLQRQKLPDAGGPVTQPTSFRILVGREAIYLGIRCEQDVELVARRTRRDRAIESDRIHVDIDSRGRGKDAFHFEVTAGGSMVDGIRYNDTTLDLQWDGNWLAEVSRDPRGWTVEMEIPFRILRRPPGSRGPTRIQVRRYISRLGETDEWAPTPRDNSQEVARYGVVAGLELPPRRVMVDVTPYFSAGSEVETATSSPAELVRRYGGDLKLRAGSDTTLDATVFPDFGTVEADVAVFNLTTAELRFPEKRPFFQEGVDVLTTPLEVFYSRRIGSLTGSTAGNVVETAPPAPVLGATKLLTRPGKHGSLAVLAAVTGTQDVTVRDADVGATAPQRVAPLYTYGLLRAIRDLPNAGYVGMIGGGRFSFDGGPGSPWTDCPDGQSPAGGACFADVYLLSSDLLVRSRDGRWRSQAQLVGTYRQGGTPVRQLDGNVVESGDAGGASKVRVERVGGRIIGYLDYEWLGRDAEWNATGFLPVPNRHRLRSHLGAQTLTPHGPVLEDRWQLEWVSRFALDGRNVFSAYQGNYKAKWNSFWTSFTEVHLRPRHWDDREARDGTAIQRSGVLGLEHEMKSDHRRRVVWELESTTQLRTTQGLLENGLRVEGETGFDINIVPPLQVRLGVDVTYDAGEPRWVETDEPAGVRRFARLDARALGLLTRINYTITPRLELQLYLQLLGAGTVFRGGRTVPIDDSLVHLEEMTPDPSFVTRRETEALLVGNLFLRWEYSPGSNLYLVATRNQLDPTVDDGDGGIDYASVGQNPASYLFLVKVTRLFGW